MNSRQVTPDSRVDQDDIQVQKSANLIINSHACGAVMAVAEGIWYHIVLAFDM